MTVTISSKVQVAIPAVVRRKLGLNKGVHMSVHVQQDRVVLQKIRKKGWRSLRGIGKGSRALAFLEQEHRLEVERDEALPRGS